MFGIAAASADPIASSKSLVPGYPDVIGEYLQIPGEPTAGTPVEFSTASFLRLRTAADGAAPKPANAVIVAMPGFASTPSHWLYLASQLVHKASQRECSGQPCRLEVWVIQRRGANLAETQGGLQARAKRDPGLAIDYYFSRALLNVDQKRPGKWPLLPPAQLIGTDGAKFRPLQQDDVRFMSEWGFEAYAGDADRMIKLIKRSSKNRNVFLAGHSQGGAFVANYAGRLQGGKRGFETLAGLIFLDGGPAAGTVDAATAANIKEYFERVAKLRSGWIEGGGKGGADSKAGKALLWLNSQAYAPARSNIKPVAFTFTRSGTKTLDASNMVATNWYPSERYDSDMQFWGRFKTIKVSEQGVNVDIDKAAISKIPVYVARQSSSSTFGNPFPLVTDFTEVNKTGTHQTPAAMQLTPFDKGINSALYLHTDYYLKL